MNNPVPTLKEVFIAASRVGIPVESALGRIGYWHIASDEFHEIDLGSDKAFGSARFISDFLNWVDFPTVERVLPGRYGYKSHWSITGCPRGSTDLVVRGLGETLAQACANALVGVPE